MTPIFDCHTLHVGWFKDDQIFDRDTRWVGFVWGGHAWSAASGGWLGPFSGGSFVDQAGHPVAWLGGTQPTGAPALRPLGSPVRPVTPLRPVRPIAPRRPLFPSYPLGGWSTQAWDAWLQRAAPESQADGAAAPAGSPDDPVAD